MYFRELNEDIANFADHAAGTLGTVHQLAGQAYNKLKGAVAGAHADLKADLKQAVKQAELVSKKQVTPVDAASIIADIILASTPSDEADLEPIKHLGAEQLSIFLGELDKAHERLTKFTPLLFKTLKASEFLNAIDKVDIKLKSITGDQPEHLLDKPEELLMQDKNKEQELWRLVITSNDVGAVGKAALNLLAKISRSNEAKNLAGAGTNQGLKRTYPVGTALVKTLSAQRQVLESRLLVLKNGVEKLASKPITTEQLIQLRELIKIL